MFTEGRRFPVGHPTRLLLPGELVETEFEDAPLTSELRAMILEGLANVDEDAFETEDCLQYEAYATMNELNSVDTGTSAHKDPKQSSNVVSWAAVKAATATDPSLQDVLKLLVTGFPVDNRTLPSTARPYFPYSSSLYELDGVLMLSDCIVIPTKLRPDILNLLHAAHQGIDRMKARAGDAVFWPEFYSKTCPRGGR